MNIRQVLEHKEIIFSIMLFSVLGLLFQIPLTSTVNAQSGSNVIVVQKWVEGNPHGGHYAHAIWCLVEDTPEKNPVVAGTHVEFNYDRKHVDKDKEFGFDWSSKVGDSGTLILDHVPGDGSAPGNQYWYKITSISGYNSVSGDTSLSVTVPELSSNTPSSASKHQLSACSEFLPESNPPSSSDTGKGSAEDNLQLESPGVSKCKEMIKSNVFNAQICFYELAEKNNDWKLCLESPDVFNCVGNLAITNHDPTPILELTAPPTNPNEITLYGEDVRNQLLQQYVIQAYDVSALELITDNRVHDGTLILSLSTIPIGTGLSPVFNYCDNLRGNLQYDLVFNNSDNLSVEEEIISNKNQCEGLVAAFRDLKHGTDECTQTLSSRITELYGYEVEDTVKSCKDYRTEIKKKIIEAAAKDAGIDMKNLDITKIDVNEVLEALTDEDVDVKNFSGFFEDSREVQMPVKEELMSNTTTKKAIPDWVRNNAKWWADGQIDDDSFIQGLQFMIKEGIMDIPVTEQGTGTGTSKIPSWIKNNVAWWADGQIDDESFIQGIQFMIKEGILKV